MRQDPAALGPDPVVLPQDQTNSTRIDFKDPLLNKIMPLVSGGYLRIGGTYTVSAYRTLPPLPGAAARCSQRWLSP